MPKYSSVVLLVLAMILGPRTVGAQELNCSVLVNYRALTGTDFTFLDDLQLLVSEYMNTRQWTEDRFEERERIDCSLSIIFTEALTLTTFKARLVLASRRPIYGSAQRSAVLQLSDDAWQFEYSQGTSLIFDPDRYHALTSVLNFYAYILLGYDYDTFDDQGGEVHFENARSTADRGQSVGAAGWGSLSGGQSRGELISQIMDPRFRVLRTAYFNYHYGCLDHFVNDADAARAVLLNVVQNLSSLRDQVTRAYYLDQFFSAKFKEIASVFKGSPEATRAFDALSQMDPAHISDYSQMIN